jgi:hypothetical protein
VLELCGGGALAVAGVVLVLAGVDVVFEWSPASGSTYWPLLAEGLEPAKVAAGASSAAAASTARQTIRS